MAGVVLNLPLHLFAKCSMARSTSPLRKDDSVIACKRMQCQTDASEPIHLNRSLPGNVRAIRLLSFMSSLYLMLLLGNISEIAMETCPVF